MRAASRPAGIKDLMADLSQVHCPSCGQRGSLELSSRLVARPIGSFSIAGQQMKFSAVDTPALVCRTPECGFYKLPSAS